MNYDLQKLDISDIFENLIKGITYFCHDKNYVDSITGPIERRYIERLIYIQLYMHAIKKEDEHIFRMKLECVALPDTQIECKIEYDNNFPYKVIITKIISGKITRMTYTKSFQTASCGNKYYDPIVECIIEESGNKYLKLSSFNFKN